jgi:putative tricarboxylic transport membrane protein
MWGSRLKASLPHVLVLIVGIVLYQQASNVSYTPRPGQLGPDLWPKIAVGLIIAGAFVEIVRRLMSGEKSSELRAVVDTLTEGVDDGTPADAPRQPLLLAAGIALIGGYAVLVPKLGFLLASFAFLVIFMYLGGIRRHVVVWLTSAISIVVFAFVFLKVVYVSIPRGEPPFDQATQLVMDLLLIK